MRTAKRLGVETVAVFSEADTHAQHVRLADAAVCVGGVASADSYLRYDRVLEAARSTGAEAIHPGYGFLSENAAFADAVREAGLTFIGPPAQSMRDMGAKDASKRLMEEAGVPLLPGYHGLDQDWETLEREALACGLSDSRPVMLKAVLGGGGKGMRVVNSHEELREAYDGAKREALASFGDDRLLVERYLPSARHIEVQVFCDQHGGAVYLFERDCSVQRRHQKVLEEAPAPGVDAALRKQLGEAAVRAALKVGYEGAGTVEFIADATDPSQFFFMEMNTRLQVEHPVTEMVTGVDLVEWQLRVAAGEPLPLIQEALTLSGHSFEARVYAERPEAGFLPGSGTLEHLRTPSEYGHTYVDAPTRAATAGHAVRLDMGVGEGDEISVFYDPMIAKLIVRGADRPSALHVLRRALAEWETVGVPTNVPFLRRVLDTKAFADAHVHTAFIGQHEDVLLPAAPPPPPTRMLHLAVLQWAAAQAEALAAATPAHSPFGANAFMSLGGSVCGGGGLLSPLEVQPLDFDGQPSGEAVKVMMRRITGESIGDAGAATQLAFEMSIASNDVTDGAAEGSRVELLDWCSSDRTFRALIDGCSVSGRTVLDASADEGTAIHLFVDGAHAGVLVSDIAQQAQRRLSASTAGAAARQSAVHSPMPGKIVRVLVSEGQSVAAGEALVVLEAMKMEHTMRAPLDATVGAVHATEGEVVGQRALLLSFADDGAETASAA